MVHSDLMMVNFMCQLNWTTGCPCIQLNITLQVSVRGSLDEINIWIGRVSKADCHPQCGWAKAWIGQKDMSKGEFPFSLPVFELKHRSSAFGLGVGPDLIPLALLVLGPSDLNWENWTIGSPGSLACPLQILWLLSLHTTWTNSL